MKGWSSPLLVGLIGILFPGHSWGFLGPSATPTSNTHPTIASTRFHPHEQSTCWTPHSSLQRQRRSVANIQTMGIFGLGAPELVIIALAAAFLIGPQALGNMAGQIKGGLDGDLPEDLKAIPEEFKKGVEEGEANARARKAKSMDPVPTDKEE